MRFSLQYLVSFTSLSVCEWVCFVCQLNLFFCHFIVIYESNAVELWWKILDNSISTAQSDDAFLDVCGDNIRHISKSMWNAFYQFDIWYDGFKWRSYTRLCVFLSTWTKNSIWFGGQLLHCFYEMDFPVIMWRFLSIFGGEKAQLI